MFQSKINLKRMEIDSYQIEFGFTIEIHNRLYAIWIFIFKKYI